MGQNLSNMCRYVVNIPSVFENLRFYRALSHDVTAAILVFQNNEMAAMLVFQTNPLGFQRFSYVNALFCPNKCA